MKAKVYTYSFYDDYYEHMDRHYVVLLIGRTEYRSRCGSAYEARNGATRLRSILRHQGIELVEE
jgi:hypothetical protein